ncbi:MAG: hypothetical protein ACMV0I_05215 [Pseudomonas sp.]
MKTYEPKLRAYLVKVVDRKEIASGKPASADRYKVNPGIELTGYLGQHGGVRISKGVREPAGAFSITMVDKPHSKLLDSLYALIEPMDMIEFRLAHNPHDYAKPEQGYSLPIVMRGLVSSINRGESMQNGIPMRAVTITGHDFGKILQTIQIFYLNNSVVGDNIVSGLGFFQKYSESGAAKHMPANDFLLDAVQKVVAPYIAKMLMTTRAQDVGATKLENFTVKANIPGVVSPFAAASFRDVSVYQMLASLLDVGPFNEMFMRDDEDGLTLVARPAPLRTAAGEWVQTDSSGQPAKADGIAISSHDVQSINLGRTDAGVANYYWVENERWTLMHSADARMAAMQGEASSFIAFDYPNSNASLYGIRKMEVFASLGPPNYMNADGPKEGVLAAQTNEIGGWLAERRRILADINKDNVVFESGTIRLRGNEKIKAGHYLVLTRGVGEVVSEYYITRVEHDFRPFIGFFTTVHVERGTSFIERAGRPNPINFAEVDAGGVS